MLYAHLHAYTFLYTNVLNNHIYVCFLDHHLFIGLLTKTRLGSLTEEGDISLAQQSNFYKSVRAFDVRALEYTFSNLPLKDDLMQNAKFLNFHGREITSLSKVEYFVKR